ncbi:MAG: hypothetical protein Q8R04_03980 [Nanoarchaeota archaeon]|nr:hypothetical protein [Nanoarchaeota archaeon]
MVNKKFAGNLFLIVVSLVAILFFLFGLMLILVSLRKLILSEFRLNLLQILYLIIGFYIIYNSIKKYIKFYKNAIKNPYRSLNEFYQNNKIEIIITTIISIILLFIYYNGLYLDYNFILKMILFFPIFIFQNLIFVVKVFSKATLKPILLSSIFDLILPIVEVYYVFVIVQFILKLFNKHKFKNK